MNEPINVIIAAGQRDAAVISEALAGKAGFKTVAKTSDYDRVIQEAEGVKRPVVVMRVREITTEVRRLAGRLSEGKISFICICNSANAGFTMLQTGAVGMFTRSEAEFEPRGMINVLTVKIKEAYDGYFRAGSRILKGEFGAYDKVIAMGSSTGGTEIVLKILKELPADTPPILIVQHMPPVFTKLYAERLHANCLMSVWEAQDGDILRRGLALLAPGDFQMTLKTEKGVSRVHCFKAEKENGHCPSVDVLFRSVARAAGAKAVGVILTGMGRDGANGLLEMRQCGAVTLGQDEASCVVYGMPREAYEVGAVVRQVSAEDMARAILESL